MLLMQKAEILEVRRSDCTFTYTLSLRCSCLLQIMFQLSKKAGLNAGGHKDGGNQNYVEKGVTYLRKVSYCNYSH